MWYPDSVHSSSLNYSYLFCCSLVFSWIPNHGSKIRYYSWAFYNMLCRNLNTACRTIEVSRVSCLFEFMNYRLHKYLACLSCGMTNHSKVIIIKIFMCEWFRQQCQTPTVVFEDYYQHRNWHKNKLKNTNSWQLSKMLHIWLSTVIVCSNNYLLIVFCQPRSSVCSCAGLLVYG